MELAIGSSLKSTVIKTEECRLVLSPDKGDKLIVLLGINRVEIEYVDGSWTIAHGPNVVSTLLLQSDPKAFCAVGTPLTTELTGA